MEGPAPARVEIPAEHMIRLEAALRQNEWVWEILTRFDEVALPDGWLVAGCIAQTVWNLAFGQPAEFGIKDIDLIYFDAADLSAKAEADHNRRLRDQFRLLPMTLDVKNEARTHFWYERTFGYPIAPYSSTAEAIATFPTTATSVGVRQSGGHFECCAPYGLDDLFALIVRANRTQVRQVVYEAKVNRWRSTWPGLTFLPWGGALRQT